MVDIEKQLVEILGKYRLCKSQAEMRREMYYLVQHLFMQLASNGERVAIRCAGRHTYFLLKEFSHLLPIKYLIDANPDNVMELVKDFNIPIVSDYEEIKDQVDVVIISTTDYRDVIKQELIVKNCRNIVDLYDYLSENGYEIDTEFYNFYNEPYKILIEKKQEYYAENNTAKEKICLDLISEFIGNRDFLSAFMWIDEYVNHNFNDAAMMVALKQELNEFLDMIKDKYREQHKKDIFWFWQDGLQYYMVDKMPFLSSMKQEGLWFENSFTNSAVTRSVYGNILDKEFEVERYRNGKSTDKNHLLTRFLEANGYKSYKIGKVEQKKIDLNLYDYAKSTCQLHLDVPLTELYWNGLRTAIMSEAPLMILMHSGIETHIPCMAPTLDEYRFNGVEYLAERFTDEGRDAFLNQLEKCVTYLDNELSFYRNIIGDDSIKIYMSDHGDVLTEKSYKFTRDCAQTVLAVESTNIASHHVEKMFQTSDYLELFEYILDSTDENEQRFCHDEIRVNGVDFYNKKVIEKYIDMGWGKYGLAYDGYITPTDRYILLATGEELYALKDDDYTNVIHHPAYRKRVDYFRHKLQKEKSGFLDINSIPKFTYSKLIYENLKKERVVK